MHQSLVQELSAQPSLRHCIGIRVFPSDAAPRTARADVVSEVWASHYSAPSEPPGALKRKSAISARLAASTYSILTPRGSRWYENMRGASAPARPQISRGQEASSSCRASLASASEKNPM